MKSKWTLYGILAVAVIAIIVGVAGNDAPTGEVGTAAIFETLASGLKIRDIEVGTGTEAKTGDMVAVHYTGMLEDGTKFDSSYDRGVPLEFLIGAGQLIPGWEEGISGMRVGGKRELVIPPSLAYGEDGAGLIPPNATLTFEVELVTIIEK